MAKRILVIQGHPDPSGNRFCHALAAAYSDGARKQGHEVDSLDIARLKFDFLRSKEDWQTGQPPDDIAAAQTLLLQADHLALFYPLWLGSMPALLKGFLEQIFRPGFALSKPQPDGKWEKLLLGKSAHIIVTMGMPALIYRWYFGAHSLKSLERNILGFCGIGPIRETLIGGVETTSNKKRIGWIEKMQEMGGQAR